MADPVASSVLGRTERLKAAYERLDAAHHLVQASHGYYGFREYGQARQVLLDILDKPPMPSETEDLKIYVCSSSHSGECIPEPLEKETKFFVDADRRVWMKAGEPTWSVHNCNSQAHVKCLAEAEKTKDASGYGTIFIGDLPGPLLNITQVKEP